MSYARLQLHPVSNLLRRACYSLLCLLLSLSGALADPEVSKVWGQQKVPTYKVDIFYDLSEAATVSLAVSADGGATWGIVRVDSCSLDIGTNVTAGTGKHILWDAGADWPGQYSSAVRFKVTATPCAPDPSIPAGMALIPAGSFQMGDNFQIVGAVDGAAPVHTVYVSGFYIDKTGVTWAKWQEVRTYAAANGYDIGSVGAGKAATHPVHSINWYDCVKWCNARSQKEGLTPCYTRVGSTYKTGQYDDIVCNWSANGFRLPTEAEREKAARGGLSGKRFPWGDTFDNTRANCGAGYDGPDIPRTSPAGSFAANGYGLYDMSGNLAEWCWDWLGDYPSGSVTNPHGGGSGGGGHMQRGGSWANDAYYCTSACRYGLWLCSIPGTRDCISGFRTVRYLP